MFTKTLISMLLGMVCGSLAQFIDNPFKYTYQIGDRSFMTPTGSLSRSRSDFGNLFRADQTRISSSFQPRRHQLFNMIPTTFDRRTRGFDRQFGNSAMQIAGFDGLFAETKDHPQVIGSTGIPGQQQTGLQELIGSITRHFQAPGSLETGIQSLKRELINIQCYRGTDPYALLNIECYNGATGKKII